MTLAPNTRSLLSSLLIASFVSTAPVWGQESPPAGEPAIEAAAAQAAGDVATSAAPFDERRTSYEIRSGLGEVLRSNPPELATILKLDPTLLSNEAFLASYPDLGRFVAGHPEVRRNPRFYLAEFPLPESGMSDFVETVVTFSVFLVVISVFAWLVRTVIEQRRWSRLSRTQSEVHNKILERFGTSDALLEYMRSPAGTKFLESAPIPLHTDQAPQNAPVGRALWSIQVGVVVAAGALGMLLVGGRLEGDGAQGFFALGVIGICLGAGFVLSALVSLLLSRRLGLWQGSPEAQTEPVEPTGFGR
jgi:hypothetical protein